MDTSIKNIRKKRNIKNINHLSNWKKCEKVKTIYSHVKFT